MATIADIGTPGDPLAVPPLTEWQAAVRDHLTADVAWTSWAPSVGGAAYSSIAAAYRKQGQHVTLTVKGVVSAVTGDITFSLPAAAHADQVGAGVGTVRALIAANSTYHMHAYLSGSTTLAVRAAGTNGVSTPISATVPATWQSGNYIAFTATYRSAS